jgi:aspartyl-tRNA(Asn)/glutamyl-tRNA(Gln) amidotransferase subunit A
MAAAATGSEAGGSIRMPAALCGVFGLKPSFGLVPMDTRPSAFGAKTHHIALGPITRTVADAALLMEVMAGPDPRDPSSIPVELDYRRAIDRSIDGLQVAYSHDFDAFEIDDAVGSLVTDALDAFTAAGASVEQTSIEHGLQQEELADVIETTFCASMAGHVAVLKEETDVDLRAHPETSESLLRWLDLADELDHTDVALTGIPRTRLFDAIQTVFEEYDLLVTPTVGRVGVDLHQGVEEHNEWLRHHNLTWPFNITGHPAASVPVGLTEDGDPVGMQIVGRRYEDDTVLAASAAIERELSWPDNYLPVNA